MFKKLTEKIENKVISYSFIGVKKENLKEFNDFIIKKNSIGMYSTFVFILAAIYHLFLGDYSDSFLYFLTSLVMMSSLFTNNIKYLYGFKFVTLTIINIIILTVCLFFKKNELYIFIFFIMIYTINILYSLKNYLYIIFLTIQSLVFIFLVHYKEHIINESPVLDNNVFSNFIFFLLLFLGINGISSYINYYKDRKYLKNKAKLFKSNKSIKNLNEEIEQLNIAALHSLKTPIYVANDFVKKLHHNCINDIHTENQHEYEQLIKNSITLSRMYIENLTTFTRIITETHTKTPFNLLDKISFVANVVSKKFKDVDIKINNADINVKANDFCFIIVIENLLNNGLKYNINSKKKCEIIVTKKEFEVHILITDNGIGIDEIYFDRIFSPFVRIERGLEIDGTGLGLSSVKMAANKMNGNVRVLSSNQYGTTFEFTFKYV